MFKLKLLILKVINYFLNRKILEENTKQKGKISMKYKQY